MAWTEMQKQAIYKRGTNIIVSAGAGSGKTAVLSERILELCKSNVNVDEVLVLTFTNAAAAEMKERIRKKLNAAGLVEQVAKIDGAAITTFDAYSLSLVKKFYYKLGLSKDIKIIDQALLEYYKKKLIDEIFNEGYISQRPSFFNLLKNYAKQNDENVKAMVLSLAQKLELLVNTEDFIANYSQNYLNEEFIADLVKQYEQVVLEEAQALCQDAWNLQNLAQNDENAFKLSLALNDLVNGLQAKNYEDLARFLINFNLPRINPSVSETIKNEKKELTEKLNKFLKQYLVYPTLDSARCELIAIKPAVLELLNLVQDFLNRLYQYKLSIMAFDYLDIAKMAIKLVKENGDVLALLKTGFKEILIDEYQDTSDLQEAFISAISNNNCYMVGDLKQSIYRFRNANPYIFKQKYAAYGANDGGYKIDLTFNFRSRKEVIANINSLFCQLLTLDCGDADYALDHQMHFGQENYDKLKQNYNYNFEVLSYESSAEFSDEEVEAFLVGNEIKKLLNQNLKTLKDGEFKPCKYSDIAILIEKTKSFSTFKRVFEYLGIPLSIEAALDLNDSILPKIFCNILKVIVGVQSGIYDQSYYHALASVARSFICCYSDEQVYKLVVLLEEDPLNALFKDLAILASDLPIVDLYTAIIEKFKIYEKLYLLGDVDNCCVILEYLYTIFKSMHEADMTLEIAQNYLTTVFDSGISLKYRLAKEKSDSVRIMTIHKSKGLEFPFCFFPLLSAKFNEEELKDTFGFSTKYGIFIPYSGETNSDTIIRSLVQKETKAAAVSEKVRLFYVALTRAREKIFLISNDQDLKASKMSAGNYNSFNCMLKSLNFIQDYERHIDIKDLKLTKNYKLAKNLLEIGTKEKLVYEEINLSTQSLSTKPISKEVKELLSDEVLQAMELGRLFHECLEVLDLANPDLNSLPVADLIKNKLAKILDLPLFKAIKEAKVYHEHEFYFTNDTGSYHGIIDLFAEYADHIDIIDYKLSQTDSVEYLKQLGIYKAYISANSTKKINCYLLSIMKAEIIQID